MIIADLKLPQGEEPPGVGGEAYHESPSTNRQHPTQLHRGLVLVKKTTCRHGPPCILRHGFIPIPNLFMTNNLFLLLIL